MSANLSAQHLEDRVLDRVNNIMRDLEAARKQHVPVAGRMKPTPTDGKAASRQKLLRTSANCLFITRRALATCAQHYTLDSMAAIRKKCRSKEAKRKRADDGKQYLAEHNRKTEHWAGRQRTQPKDTLQRKAVGTVMTKKFKEDTDVDELHTNSVKVVVNFNFNFNFKTSRLGSLITCTTSATPSHRKKCVPQVPLNRLSWNSFRSGWMPMTTLAK